MWGVGCVLAGMMFQKEPFFKGLDNNDQMIKIAKVVGTEDVQKYAEKFGLDLTNFQEKLLK